MAVLFQAIPMLLIPTTAIINAVLQPLALKIIWEYFMPGILSFQVVQLAAQLQGAKICNEELRGYQVNPIILGSD